MTKTIHPQHAADLYDLFGDDGEISDRYQNDTNAAHEWTVLGSTPSRTFRWHKRYWMVLCSADGETYGIEYGVGLTENQEEDLPWYGASRPLPLTRLYPHEVTTTVYRTDAP